MPSPARISRILTSADGTRIYANAVGVTDSNINTKPSIVFIHGFSMSSIVFDNLFEDQDWMDVAVLVRYDMRGHGRSGKPTDEASWESKRLAEDFDAVMKGFGLIKPFVVGWSLGATNITDVLSFQPPSYLHGIVYLSALPYMGPVLAKVGYPETLMCLPPLTQTTDVDAFQKAARDFVDLMVNDQKDEYHTLHQAMLGDILIQPRAVTVRLLSRVQDTSGLLSSGKAGADLPLLVIYNKKDRVANSQEAIKAVGGPGEWKDIEVVEIEEGDHMPWLGKDSGNNRLFKKAMFDWVEKKIVAV